jgi:hypothetical protein
VSDALRSVLEFEWLTGLGPGWVTGLVVAGYVALLVYGASRRSEFIYEGAPDHKRIRDLRLWLVPVVLVQILLYLWLSGSSW